MRPDEVCDGTEKRVLVSNEFDPERSRRRRNGPCSR